MALFLLSIGVIAGNEVARSWLVVLAALVFVVPIAALLAFLACLRSPVISLYDDRIELASAAAMTREIVAMAIMVEYFMAAVLGGTVRC